MFRHTLLILSALLVATSAWAQSALTKPTAEQQRQQQDDADAKTAADSKDPSKHRQKHIPASMDFSSATFPNSTCRAHLNLSCDPISATLSGVTTCGWMREPGGP